MKLFQQRPCIDVRGYHQTQALSGEFIEQAFLTLAADDQRLREQLAGWRLIVDQTGGEAGDQRLADGLAGAVHALQ
ncbi:hypothetical protein D3C80_2007980 [compost metagenome]